MDLSDVIEQTTINFPRSLGMHGVERMLRYVAKHLPANVGYDKLVHVNIDHKMSEDCPGDDVSKKHGALWLSGEIKRTNENYVFDNFSCSSGIADYNKISVLKFFQVPGWDIKDYGDDKIKLWNDVRRLVSEYFVKRNL